nr:uncharacterized protein LOC129445423 isoform X1 [Misgurnus anguillicaudatus]
MEPEVEGGRLGLDGGERNRMGQAPLLRGGRGPRHRGGLRPHQRGGHGPRLRGVGERGRGQDHRPRQQQQQQRVSNEIRAMVVDYVVNHGMTMNAAATMFQPNLRRSSVASIIRAFRNENRIEIRPNRGGRSKILTDQQEQAVVNMVRVRNYIRLREIRQHILDNEDVFRNVEAISLLTIARVLKRHQVCLKQLYNVPFERNTERVKQLRNEYVRRVMKLDADENHHKFLFLDEAGFNLAKTRRRGGNVIGQRATVTVPGQRGANIPMCAAISEDGVVGRRPRIGSYNAALLIAFLEELNQVCRADGVTCLIVWDNVQFPSCWNGPSMVSGPSTILHPVFTSILPLP